ncbi:MAG: hypothetical protein QOC91_1600, partial [Solirubrobacteraceae bacterium]|nr:hypothetical protein [Solirubrobacteraceae bacterium]
MVSRPPAILACCLACALTGALPGSADAASPAPGSAPQPSQLAARASTDSTASHTASASSNRSGQSTSSDAPIAVAPSDTPPAGRRLSPNDVLVKAERLAKMRAVRARYPGSYGGAYLKGPLHWQVSFFSRKGKQEIGQVIIDDPSGSVLEQWTGFQVAWTMARGYPGAFGRHVNALYIWLPMCVLFLLPFLNFRRPLSLLHL